MVRFIDNIYNDSKIDSKLKVVLNQVASTIGYKTSILSVHEKSDGNYQGTVHPNHLENASIISCNSNVLEGKIVKDKNEIARTAIN